MESAQNPIVILEEWIQKDQGNPLRRIIEAHMRCILMWDSREWNQI